MTDGGDVPGAARRLGMPAAATAWLALAVAFFAVCGGPLAFLALGAWRSLAAGDLGFTMTRELVATSLFAAGAAAGAGAAAMALLRPTVGALADRVRVAAAVALVGLGLLGPLAVALLVLQAFQWPVLRLIVETPIPLLVALTLVLLPLALPLAALLRRLPAAGVHLARLMSAAEARGVRAWAAAIVWELQTRPRAWALLLLFVWAYFDLTASSLLAPVTMPTAPARLYNLMHYGQSTALTVNVLLAAALPAAVVALAAVAIRMRSGWARG